MQSVALVGVSIMRHPLCVKTGLTLTNVAAGLDYYLKRWPLRLEHCVKEEGSVYASEGRGPTPIHAFTN